MSTSPLITVEQFGQQIKRKYPAYASRSDDEVGQAMLKKYPQYASRVYAPSQTSIHPEARTVGNFLSEATRGVGRGLKNDVAGAYQTLRHPIDTATGLVTQTEDAATKAAKEFKDTKGAPFSQRVAAAELTGLENAPMIGGMVQHAEQGGERMFSPESIGATAEGFTTLAAPEMVGHALPKIADVVRDRAANVGAAPREIGELVGKVKDANEAEAATRKLDLRKHFEKKQAAKEVSGASRASFELAVAIDLQCFQDPLPRNNPDQQAAAHDGKVILQVVDGFEDCVLQCVGGGQARKIRQHNIAHPHRVHHGLKYQSLVLQLRAHKDEKSRQQQPRALPEYARHKQGQSNHLSYAGRGASALQRSPGARKAATYQSAHIQRIRRQQIDDSQKDIEPESAAQQMLDADPGLGQNGNTGRNPQDETQQHQRHQDIRNRPYDCQSHLRASL